MGKDYVVLQKESEELMAHVRFLWAPRWVAILIAALTFSASTIAPAEAQELKKVRIGYPAFSLTFLTFFVAKDAGIFKKNGFDVDLVQLADAVQTSALVAGEIDYLTGITGPLVAAARGLPFKGITITHYRPLFWVIASAEISQGGRPSRQDRGRGPPGNAPRYRRQRPHQKKRDESRESHVHPNRLGLKQRSSAQPRICGGRSALAGTQCDHDAERLPRARITNGIQYACRLRRNRNAGSETQTRACRG